VTEPTIGSALARLRKALSSAARAYFGVWSRKEVVEGFYARGVCDGKALAFRSVAAGLVEAPKLLTVKHLKLLASDAEKESKRIADALAAGEYSR
jgi:hypothetical protein